MNPNPMQAGKSFLRHFFADYLLYNKAYIWMNIVAGSIVEMWNIPSSNITPHTSGTLGIDYFIYDPGDGKTLRIDQKEIIYFKDYDPLNMITPDSSLTSIATTAQNDLAMQAWSKNTYGGNGRLPGVMTFADMIPDPLWDQIGEDINEASTKQNILRLRGTGTGAVNWIQTSSPPKDMEFYTGRDKNRDEIWNRIAPGLVSMLSESATEANARTGKATLIDFVVYPILGMFYETLTTQALQPYYGTDLKIEPDDIRVTDRVLELQEKQEHSKVLTVDEYRKEWGDKPIGDKELGKMLVSRAQSYAAPSEAPPVQPQDKQVGTLPADTANAQTDIQSQQQQVTAKAKDPRPAMLEIEKWERMAKKSVKKSQDFECYNIPRKIELSIKADLPNCANPAAVVTLFDNARDAITAEMGIVESPNADLTIEAIRAALNYKVK